MTRTLTEAALAAKSIRKELKQLFPHVRISVKSENYAGGDAVNISWENGVTKKAVDSIVNKYQYGHFNSMEDIYEYSNNIENLPQVKFISTQRKITENIIEEAFLILKETLDLFKGVNHKNDSLLEVGLHDTPASFLKYHYLRKCDLSEGLKEEMLSSRIYNDKSY
jgi:hypothetical protein